jgi:AhpD family alkylhydroperoxidase
MEADKRPWRKRKKATGLTPVQGQNPKFYNINISAMSDQIKEFRDYREKMNERLLAADNKIIKRIFNLDTNTYTDGALSAKVKEMLGLATSMVLRCDDCIKYHLEKCMEQGVTKDELMEIFAVANLVGGTIVIPHTRRALEYWEDLEKE